MNMKIMKIYSGIKTNFQIVCYKSHQERSHYHHPHHHRWQITEPSHLPAARYPIPPSSPPLLSRLRRATCWTTSQACSFSSSSLLSAGLRSANHQEHNQPLAISVYHTTSLWYSGGGGDQESLGTRSRWLSGLLLGFWKCDDDQLIDLNQLSPGVWLSWAAYLGAG